MTITDSELLAIEARAMAATGGKWWVDNSDSDVWGVGDAPSPLTDASYPIAQNIIDEETSDFIAHCGGDNGDVLRLVAEVRRLREECRWSGIKTAPLDGTDVLLAVQFGNESVVVVGYFCEDLECWLWNNGHDTAHPPTHWRKKPAFVTAELEKR